MSTRKEKKARKAVVESGKREEKNAAVKTEEDEELIVDIEGLEEQKDAKLESSGSSSGGKKKTGHESEHESDGDGDVDVGDNDEPVLLKHIAYVPPKGEKVEEEKVPTTDEYLASFPKNFTEEQLMKEYVEFRADAETEARRIADRKGLVRLRDLPLFPEDHCQRLTLLEPNLEDDSDSEPNGEGEIDVCTIDETKKKRKRRLGDSSDEESDETEEEAGEEDSDDDDDEDEEKSTRGEDDKSNRQKKVGSGAEHLSAVSLRHYRRHFDIPTKSSATKKMMVEAVEKHLKTMPMADPSYMVPILLAGAHEQLEAEMSDDED